MNKDTLSIIYALMSTYWKFIKKYHGLNQNSSPDEWDEFTNEGCIIGEMYKDNEAMSRFNQTIVLACIGLIESSARGQIGEIK